MLSLFSNAPVSPLIQAPGAFLLPAVPGGSGYGVAGYAQYVIDQVIADFKG
jgi:hypothetical protein